MNGFYAFAKKELIEQLRSYKALILTAVLFLFGMMSPLLAKLLPDIFGGINIEGMTITIPEPTALDAYTQFFKNVGQLGYIALLLIFSGLLSQDVTKGTLVVLLAKGLSRPAVIFSKFTSALVIWTAGYALAAAAAYGYTAYLFGSGGSAESLFFDAAPVAFRRLHPRAFAVRLNTRPRQLRRAPADDRHTHRPAGLNQLPGRRAV